MSTTHRTGAAAIRYARKEISNPSQNWRQLCLKFTRSCFGVGPRDLSAKVGWQRAKLKHPTSRAASIPAGVPIWWKIGTYDHVAISVGNGRCISTDILRSGKPDEVDIDLVSDRWGAELLGWSEDINGVDVYDGKPIYATSLTRILANARSKKRPRPRSNDVIRVQRILRRLNYMAYDKHEHGRYGPITRDAVAKAQRAQGYKGSAADGYLGTATLAWLEGKAAGTSLAFRAVR